MQKRFLIILVLLSSLPAVFAQPRSGMVTEPLDSAWVDGQRMFLTWRKGDPFAADATVVPRDNRYWRVDPVDRSKYGRPNLRGNNLVSGLDSALTRFYFPYGIEWFADLRHSLRTGQPVDHYSRVGDAFAD